MRSVLIGAAVAASMLFGSGAALAQDPEVPEAISPPTVTEVVDVPSAEAFIEGYAADNARRFIGTDRRRVRRH